MTAYIVFTREKTLDPGELDVYRAKVPAARVGHAVTGLAAYGAYEVLEGPAIEGAVILSFPTFAEAKAWYDAPPMSKPASTASRALNTGPSSSRAFHRNVALAGRGLGNRPRPVSGIFLPIRKTRRSARDGRASNTPDLRQSVRPQCLLSRGDPSDDRAADGASGRRRRRRAQRRGLRSAGLFRRSGRHLRPVRLEGRRRLCAAPGGSRPGTRRFHCPPADRPRPNHSRNDLRRRLRRHADVIAPRPLQTRRRRNPSLDALRLDPHWLTKPGHYLDPLNFVSDFIFFRDADELHTRISTVNYWHRHGAEKTRLWCRLFDTEGNALASWDRDLDAGECSIMLDSGEIRQRFGLGDFTGSLFVHVIGAAAHDTLKYAVDLFDDSGETATATHDSNPWPADFYAGLPAAAPGEAVRLWVQNPYPTAIPAGAIAFRPMGGDAFAASDISVPPYGTAAIDIGAAFPATVWPGQFEIRADKYFCRRVMRSPAPIIARSRM